MNTIMRTAAGLGSAAMLAIAIPTAANAAPESAASAPTTCYPSANKPFVVGGVGNTAKGVGVVYCTGGVARVKGVVTLQKKVNGVWRNQGAATTKFANVGGGRVQFPDTNRASVGFWRTKAVFTLTSNGQTRTVYSGQVQFVPARGGLTL